MRLSCSIVSDARDLAGLSGAWDDLLARSQADEPMRSSRWLLPWWSVFGSLGGRRLAVGVFTRGAELVGLAPLLARRHWYAPGIPFRRLELIGSGEPEEDEICSEYLGLISARGAEEDVCRVFARSLATGLFGSWDELVLPAMDGAAELPRLLASELSSAGLPARVEETGLSPYIALPATFQRYLEALPSSGRYLVNRSLRDFDRWAGGDVVLRAASSPAELEEGRRILVALHESRWSCRGAFGSPRFDAFHEAVMPALLDAGALELLWLTARGEPVACVYNLLWRGKIYHYQSGRRTDLPRAIRPGIVLHAHAIRRAIEAGLREYDFLGGDSQYKRQLAPEARPLVRVRAVQTRLREAARIGAEALAAAARASLGTAGE